MQVVASFVDILIARRLWNYRSIAYSTMQYAMFLIMREIRGKSVENLVPLLRRRLDEGDEDFDTNSTLRLHQQNRYSLKWLLARMTDHIEVNGGLASRFDEYMSEGRKNGFEVEHIWADHWEQHNDEFAHETDFDEYRNRLGGLLLLPKSVDVGNALSAMAEVYSRLAEQPGASKASKMKNWTEARTLYQKSLDAWLLLKQKAPLGKFDAAQPDKIAIEIARCDAALAKLNARNP